MVKIYGSRLAIMWLLVALLSACSGNARSAGQTLPESYILPVRHAINGILQDERLVTFNNFYGFTSGVVLVTGSRIGINWDPNWNPTSLDYTIISPGQLDGYEVVLGLDLVKVIYSSETYMLSFSIYNSKGRSVIGGAMVDVMVQGRSSDSFSFDVLRISDP